MTSHADRPEHRSAGQKVTEVLPPDEFASGEHPSPFLDLIGPVFWAGPAGPGRRLGLIVDGRHLKGRGSLHGGVISALADVLLGHAAASTTDPPTPLTTASATTDFVGPCRPGEWLEGHAEHVHVGRTLAFARGAFSAGGRPVAQASAVFRVSGASPDPGGPRS